MAHSNEGVGAPSADLLHARNQLKTLRSQLRKLTDPDTRTQVKARIASLKRSVAALEDGPEPEYQPDHSHARNNRMVFTHDAIRPLPLTDGMEDKRPPRSPMQFSHTRHD